MFSQSPFTHANSVPITLTLVFEKRDPFAFAGVVAPVQEVLAMGPAKEPTPQVGVLGLVLNREVPLPVEGINCPKTYIPTFASVEKGSAVWVTSSLIVVFCTLLTPIMLMFVTELSAEGQIPEAGEPQM
jgi:hypothetical protein